jgi:hypothetical protein
VAVTFIKPSALRRKSASEPGFPRSPSESVPDRVWRPDVDTAGVQESAEAVVEAAVLAVAVQEEVLLQTLLLADFAYD